jgi:hypothetical protein
MPTWPENSHRPRVSVPSQAGWHDTARHEVSIVPDGAELLSAESFRARAGQPVWTSITVALQNKNRLQHDVDVAD